MLALQDLTVGQVSGMIAAAVFLVQFILPVLLPVILLGLLRPRSAAVTQTAVSWSVIGRYLHGSLWPLFLRTDSAATLEACKRVLFMSFLKTFMLVLIAVTAIITPLGLYEGLVAEPSSDVAAFHYIRDPTPMGYGTPPRTNSTFSRQCGWFGLIPCPNDNNKATVFENKTLLQVNYTNDWYDTRIPQKVIDVFQSGASELGETVSSSFDIQYRSYVKSVIDDVKNKKGGPLVDNGTARTVGTYQPLSSLVLSDAILPVEGLIVDMKNGGIGFRNHSAPTFRPYGSTWTEDLLFVVPDTVCVDTNLTLDFHIARTRTEDLLAKSGIYRPEIVDHGGFVNLNKTYPFWVPDDVQANPNLWHRAYRGAWIQNAYTMAYMNVTNISNETLKVKAFSYLNSTMGKAFPLYFTDGKTAGSFFLKPNTLSIASSWGNFLSGAEGVSNVSRLTNTTYNFTSSLPIYSNPFNIGSSNWSTIDMLCRGQGGGDLANITNIASQCGLLYGAPRRKDESLSPLFDPGSAWTLPMYSCMSTAKATIKTVSFRFNGTSDDLSGLEVVSVVDKTYPNIESKPLWGVENTSMFLKDGGPLWGLISKDKEKDLNVTTIRKESLYLPGRDPFINSENNPGADFAAVALQMTYDTGKSSLNSAVDYSGKANLAMYKKWQELSRTPGTSAKILNLIWTDIAANMVVGTKGLQPHEGSKRKRDGASAETRKMPPVINYTRRIKYKYVYGIPAFTALVLFAAAILSAIFFALFAGAKPAAMRTFLQHTSVGRFLTSQSQSQSQVDRSSLSSQTGYSAHTPSLHDDVYSDAPTKVWVSGAGKQRFALGAEGWARNVERVTGYEGKSGGRVAYKRVLGEDDGR
ncbi:hypothetical protein CC86DRAFT_301012 [Ophiobolus disseminans]|uniref:Uncharacterized protein n=1 Tax=Ophiobolus disseminans TaxID=1469910 RepID=A0A6A6ZNW8_9PLEO|nr:hypothetical protein CC86DRAFT_301012 [Ophiobolus disseminans]